MMTYQDPKGRMLSTHQPSLKRLVEKECANRSWQSSPTHDCGTYTCDTDCARVSVDISDSDNRVIFFIEDEPALAQLVNDHLKER